MRNFPVSFKVTYCKFRENSNSDIWDKVFKNEPNKICGRQPRSILEYFVPYFLDHIVKTDHK